MEDAEDFYAVFERPVDQQMSRISNFLAYDAIFTETDVIRANLAGVGPGASAFRLGQDIQNGGLNQIAIADRRFMSEIAIRDLDDRCKVAECGPG